MGPPSVLSRTHNPIPILPTRLIGRAQELEMVRSYLSADEIRLLTLVGPAGIGKTRLALALAGALTETSSRDLAASSSKGGGQGFSDGIWFVDLAPLSDPSLVVSTIALELGLRVVANQALQSLLQHLRDVRLLLILDNFEHVLPAASAVDELLATCHGLKIVVTSRERLRLRREHIYPVPPLALPDLGHLPIPETLGEVPAVALFVRGAQATTPGFPLTADNARAVAEICVRLDGLPLAIELAAARVNLLPPAAMLAHLERRLPLLHWGARDMPARHRTLRAAIDWSYELLAPAEQALFRRLGGFTGGWTLEAAESVYPEADMLSLLGSLVDKSLIQAAEHVDGELRFTMLETIREYAREQLEASGELDSTCCRHAAHFLALAERAEAKLTGPNQREWVHRLEQEHANIRAALRWADEHGEAELQLRLATALRRFWRSRGYVREGRRWLEAALARHQGASLALRARALDGAGYFAQCEGAYAQARSMHQEGLELARILGDARGIAESLNNLGTLALGEGDYERANALLREALAAHREAGEDWGIALTLFKLGCGARLQMDLDRSATHHDEALALFRVLGDRRSVAVTQGALAEGAAARALRGEEPDWSRVAALFRDSLSLCSDLQDRGATAFAAEMVTHAAAERGPADRLGRLLGAVESLREATGYVRGPGEADRYARTLRTVRSRLDEQRFAAAWAAGRAMSLEQVIADALETVASVTSLDGKPKRSAAGRGSNPLSGREQEVLQLLAEGRSNDEIARALTITVRTAKFHVTSILDKLGASTRGQAVALATRRNLL